MAPIAILLSSTIGFFSGMVQFAFFGASLWQAFVTYFAVSVALSMLALATALVSDRARATNAQASTLENWQDWQTEEEMEAARLANVAQDAVEDLAIGRKSA